MSIIFNSLNIKMIKVTFFVWKEVVFGKKVAKCKKCTKQYLVMPQINRLEFWKILFVRVQFPFRFTTSSPARTSRTSTPERATLRGSLWWRGERIEVIAKKKQSRHIMAALSLVGRIGFEPMTSAVWRQRSKPTGLTSRFLRVQKYEKKSYLCQVFEKNERYW